MVEHRFREDTPVSSSMPAMTRARSMTGLLMGMAVLFLTAGTLLGHGDTEGRIVELTARIRRQPSSADLHFRRAELYRLQESWKEAAADYDRAEELAPGLPAVQFGRARMLLARSRFADAKVAIEKFLAAEPAHVEGIVTLGRIEHGHGNFLIAAGHYARAIALSPRPEPEYYVERAGAFAAAGAVHAGDAIRCLDEGIAKLGNLSSLGLPAVELEVKCGQFDAALARIERLSGVSRRKEPWLARRGDILMAAGRTTEARATYRSALDLIAKLPPHIRGTEATVSLQERLQKQLNLPAPR